jgi:hypothetical protein
MAFFIMEYRVKGYCIAHAFSRDPKAGRRVFFISGEQAGTDDINEIRRMATLPEATPKGFELFSVIDRDAQKENPQ